MLQHALLNTHTHTHTDLQRQVEFREGITSQRIVVFASVPPLLILFNSAKSVTSLWMSSCIPNNPSTRLWLLTLAGWVRNLTKITSNGFPKAVGDGFWPSWGGLLGHLGGLGEGFWVTLLSKGPQDRNRHQKCESWWLPGVPKGTPKWQFSHENLIKIRKNSSVNECCKNY